jgi:hypothetical protein
VRRSAKRNKFCHSASQWPSFFVISLRSGTQKPK